MIFESIYKGSKYIPCSTSNYGGVRIKDDVRFIVLHYTGKSGQTAIGNATYFKNNSHLGRSAHFFVDETNVVESIPPIYTAWHCGNETMNKKSIGIEICFHNNKGEWYCPERTYKNLVDLVKTLVDYYQIPPDNIIRHFDVNGKECPRGNGWEGLNPIKLMQLRREVCEMRYDKIENMPVWARKDFEGIVDFFADKNKLDVSDDMMRTLIIVKRMLTATEATLNQMENRDRTD